MPARYIDIHLLHTVPYANLNRDDLGSPKSVRYGDAEWKHFLDFWSTFMTVNGEMERLFKVHMEKLGAA